MTNPPKPQTGYVKSSKVGQPLDASKRSTIKKRWKTLRQCKKDFKQVINKAGLLDKQPPTKIAWHLSAAPVAAPGTSKHGSGYALDLSGDNSNIRKICTSLGASLVFNEKSHVHVEFANGVNVAGYFSKKCVSEQIPKYDKFTDQSTEIAELRSAGISGELKDEVMFPHILKNFLQNLL